MEFIDIVSRDSKQCSMSDPSFMLASSRKKILVFGLTPAQLCKFIQEGYFKSKRMITGCETDPSAIKDDLFFYCVSFSIAYWWNCVI